jgi:16S rRNA (cytidine1402-2'-O)-methyltransferase
VLAALTVAGLPTDRFYFEGFLPPKGGARRARIKELARIDATLILFEGGSRIADALRDLAETLGERDAAVCRELTKLHEDVRRKPLPTLAAEAGHLETRGEFVIVVGPPHADAQRLSASDVDDILKAALKTHTVKDAVAHAVELSGRPKREVYARALELSKQDATDEED